MNQSLGTRYVLYACTENTLNQKKLKKKNLIFESIKYVAHTYKLINIRDT